MDEHRSTLPGIGGMPLNDCLDVKREPKSHQCSRDDKLSFMYGKRYISYGAKHHRFLRQGYSWDYLRLDAQAFEAILQTYNVFKPIWDFVSGFGLKIKPQDEDMIAFRNRLSTDAATHSR